MTITAPETMPTLDRRFVIAATAAKDGKETSHRRWLDFLHTINAFVHPTDDTVSVNEMRPTMSVLFADHIQQLSAFYNSAQSKGKGILTWHAEEDSTDVKAGNGGKQAAIYLVDRHALKAALEAPNRFAPLTPRVPRPRPAPDMVCVPKTPVYASQQSTSVDTPAGPSEKVWTGQALPTLADDECSLF